MCNKNKVMVYNAITQELSRKEIDNDYSALQKEVDGYIEAPLLSEELERNEIDTFINEEGKLRSLPESACILNEENEIVDIVMGNIVFASHNEDGDTISLTDDQIRVVEDLCTNRVLVGSSLEDAKMLICFK